ncbi:MAG: tRNA (adenosine(37)-N6)-threonylcarbamoyltransferase complex dimerization subunit type 1 TsaB, partial [Oscillospiraceae bacterium]|nr:tRNA (adenosine(37)-N6)-threonylcarbamoyltransferase complex dimerization subunit type 1 TsaB [Oscillospiraceae bacterium]
MKILAIESSAKAASCCIAENGTLLAQYFQKSALTHSRTLLAMTEHMLSDLDMKIADIDGIAVARGPGSFTGVRIGVAAAKGLAWGADKPVCGVSTLEAMAHHISDREGLICPVMDARRSQVYNAIFEGKNLERLAPDRAIALEELAEEIKKSGKTICLVGDGAGITCDYFNKVGIEATLAPEPLLFQSAWGVAMAVEKGEFVSPDELSPVYLRLS